jgi:hypothetical protein
VGSDEAWKTRLFSFAATQTNKDGSMADAQSVATRSTYMSKEEQVERRKKIRDIMADPNLPQQDKSKQIQSLMDGRQRRSSATGSVTWSVTNSSLGDDELYWHQQQQQGQGQPQQQPNVPHPQAGHFSFGSLVVRGDRAGTASDEEGDAVMNEAPDDIFDHVDHRSVASSISDQNEFDDPNPNSFLLPPGTYRQMHGRSLSLQDWNEEDKRAALASVTPALFANHPGQIGRFMEHSRPHCDHYERHCTIISPCCGLPFGCRICHDDCPVLPPPKRQAYQPVASATQRTGAATAPAAAHGGDAKFERRHSMPLNLENDEFDDDQHHLIDRFAIREVICRNCFTKQSSKT